MIPLYLIETFVLFGESANLVKTAQVLNQTQPTTSRQIELLQSYFKKPLFKTVGRNKLLTDYGQKVQAYYKNSVLELRDLQNKMSSVLFNNEKEKLILAARSEILEKYISPLHFNGTTEMIALQGQEIRQRMQNQNLDVAVLQENFESYAYFRKKLFTSSWKVIFPESWKIKLSDAEQFLNQASPLPFASYDKDFQTIKRSFTKKLKPPVFNVEVIASDWRLILDAVCRQRCWSIVPEDFSKGNRVSSYAADHFMKPSQFYIYFLKDIIKNPDLNKIIENLKI
jgi:DNA-binding transcriptional LysR family regulator